MGPPAVLINVLLLLKATNLVWAAALGPDESFLDVDGRVPSLSSSCRPGERGEGFLEVEMWRESKHAVFRKLTKEIKSWCLLSSAAHMGFARMFYQVSLSTLFGPYESSSYL